MDITIQSKLEIKVTVQCEKHYTDQNESRQDMKVNFSQ